MSLQGLGAELSPFPFHLDHEVKVCLMYEALPFNPCTEIFFSQHISALSIPSLLAAPFPGVILMLAATALSHPSLHCITRLI